MRSLKNKILKHLTEGQRYEIQALINAGKTQKFTAEQLNVSSSTISRELRRNCDQRSGVYNANLAQRKCEERHITKPKYTPWTPEVQLYVEKHIKQDYSPEQIAGRAKLEGVDCVSHESIYIHAYADQKKGGTLCTHFRRRRKKRQKRHNTYKTRGGIQDRRDIDERPSIVEEKIRVGDLEMDLVIGKEHKGAILTVNDRATGVVKTELVETKSAENVTEAVLRTLKGWKSFIHTITTDNGKEFAWHKTISAKLDIDYYFAKPYHSWERGANENFNGLLRQYFPKGHDFSQITKEELKKAETKLNNRPRKRYGYRSPNEVFHEAIKNNGEVPIAFMT